MAKEVTPVDLAALAERLDDLTAYFDNWSDTTHSADLRLAARCVRAWAKLTMICADKTEVTFSYWEGMGEDSMRLTISLGQKVEHVFAATALAAVEEVQL